jgi:hypothetical protein
MSEKNDRRILTSSNAPGAVFDLYDNDSAPEIFCDGVSGAMLTGSVTRMFFHVVTEPVSASQPREQRTLALKLVMPTNAAIETLQKTLEGFAASQAQLTAAIDAQKNAIVQMLSKSNAGEAASEHHDDQ